MVAIQENDGVYNANGGSSCRIYISADQAEVSLYVPYFSQMHNFSNDRRFF